MTQDTTISSPSLDSFIQVYNIDHIVPDNFLEIIQDTLSTTARKIERTNEDARYSNHIYFFEESKMEPTLQQYIWGITNYITQNYSNMFNVSYSKTGEYNPLRKMFNDEGYFFYMYTEHEFCDIHVDQNRRHPRDISFIIMLNDDYDGGNIEFYCGKHLLKTIYPKKHSVVVFPSNYLYAHRVTPVQNGLRCVVVYWIRID